MICPACAHANVPGSRFCNQCGRRLEMEDPPATGIRPAAPSTYTPKYLVDKVLVSRSAMEGERKQVTVLFVDIVDFSRLGERLDLEVVHEVADQTLRLMAEAVHRYEGTVNQFLGDGLMALFGAPLALEDHALRAAQAALAIQETVGAYAQNLREAHGVELALRLGLNSGPVVVGKIGDDLRMDYTAVGDTTNLAARLQAMAEPGTILMAEVTHRLVAAHVRSEALGTVTIKGRREPVSVFRLTGRRRHRSRFEVSAEAGLTQLVDRQTELGVLHDRFALAKAGHGQVVALVGEPGVGKSRLLHEFRRALEPERIVWLEGHCVPYGQARPYLPLLDMFRANFQIEEGDNLFQIETKLRQGLQRLDPDLETILPYLRAVFGLSDGDEAFTQLDPRERRRRIFDAMWTLTVAGSRRRRQVFVVEDLQWIDQSSEDYLAYVIERVATIPALLVTTHRPGAAIRWGPCPHVTRLSLGLFGEIEMHDLVRSLLGDWRATGEIVRLIREKAEGNPLFVEEITNSLRERGILGAPAAGAVATLPVAVNVPDTIKDIVSARLDHLEDAVKRTLQIAAVIGRQFGVALLTRVAEHAEAVPHHLETLTRLELIRQIQSFPEVEHAFKHALIQEVAYESLLAARRQDLHEAIGRAIEELYADRLDEHASVLAHHFGHSARRDRALSYAMLAGDRAARLYANAEASMYYARALATARALTTPAGRQAEIDAVVKLASVATTRRDVLDRDRANLMHARALAEELDDPSRLARVLYWLGRLDYVEGRPAAALEHARRSLELAEALANDRLAAPPVNLMGRIYWQQSDFTRAAELLGRSAEQMRELGDRTEESTAAGFAGVALGYLGEFGRATEYITRSVDVAEAIHNPYAEASAYLCRGVVRGERGDWTIAIADLEHARATAERVGDSFRVYVVELFEGRSYTMAGHPERGRALLEESVELAGRIGSTFALAWQKSFLARALLGLGDLTRVPALCEETIRRAEEGGDRFPAACAQRTLAEALFRLDPSRPDRAEAVLAEAIRIHGELRTRPELARTYVTQAGLLEAMGQPERALDRRATARSMFEAMGMRPHQELADR